MMHVTVKTNYLETRNPWGLPAPPMWFRARLFARDALAVVYASEVEPVYRLARVAQHGPPMLVFLHHPDARIARDHGLIPALSILPPSMTGGWEKVLHDLAARDLQSVDNPGQRLDDLDAEEEARLNRSIADEAEQRAVAAYGAYQLLAGSRVSLADRGYSRGLRPPAHPRRAHRPVGGNLAVWSGR